MYIGGTTDIGIRGTNTGTNDLQTINMGVSTENLKAGAPGTWV